MAADFAQRYISGQMPTMEMAQNPSTQTAMLTFMVLQLPLSLMFWHAPALVHWHQVPPIKSVFFSLVACLRNFWAFTVFGLVWLALLVLVVLFVSMVARPAGQPAGRRTGADARLDADRGDVLHVDLFHVPGLLSERPRQHRMRRPTRPVRRGCKIDHEIGGRITDCSCNASGGREATLEGIGL